jgi:outer membrane scaffolding protein for murein synthesis (MipA/OmpV family)
MPRPHEFPRLAGLCLAFAAQTLAAAERPLWEAGIGITALQFPDYRGSDENGTYPVPFPYFVYRGEFVRADRDWVGTFARWDTPDGARFEDSPLVRSNHYFAAGIGVAWVLGESERMVDAYD